MKLSDDMKLMGLAIMAGAGLIWWATRPGTAGKLAAGAVGAVGDAATGAVVGVGQLFGIPATNMTQCERDLAAGRTWDASFSCPATTWIKKGVFGSTALSASEALDARRDFAHSDPRRLDLQTDPGTHWDSTPGIY
jgi:hypothetical protein